MAINQTNSTAPTNPVNSNQAKQFKVFPTEEIACWFFSCTRDYPNLTAAQVRNILCGAHCKVNDNPTSKKVSTLNFSFGDFDNSGHRDVYGYLNACKQFPVPVGATDETRHGIIEELQEILCELPDNAVVAIKTEAERMIDITSKYGA